LSLRSDLRNVLEPLNNIDRKIGGRILNFIKAHQNKVFAGVLIFIVLGMMGNYFSKQYNTGSLDEFGKTYSNTFWMYNIRGKRGEIEVGDIYLKAGMNLIEWCVDRYEEAIIRTLEGEQEPPQGILDIDDFFIGELSDEKIDELIKETIKDQLVLDAGAYDLRPQYHDKPEEARKNLLHQIVSAIDFLFGLKKDNGDPRYFFSYNGSKISWTPKTYSGTFGSKQQEPYEGYYEKKKEITIMPNITIRYPKNDNPLMMYLYTTRVDFERPDSFFSKMVWKSDNDLELVMMNYVEIKKVDFVTFSIFISWKDARIDQINYYHQDISDGVLIKDMTSSLLHCSISRAFGWTAHGGGEDAWGRPIRQEPVPIEFDYDVVSYKKGLFYSKYESVMADEPQHSTVVLTDLSNLTEWMPYYGLHMEAYIDIDKMLREGSVSDPNVKKYLKKNYVASGYVYDWEMAEVKDIKGTFRATLHRPEEKPEGNELKAAKLEVELELFDKDQNKYFIPIVYYETKKKDGRGNIVKDMATKAMTLVYVEDEDKYMYAAIAQSWYDSSDYIGVIAQAKREINIFLYPARKYCVDWDICRVSSEEELYSCGECYDIMTGEHQTLFHMPQEEYLAHVSMEVYADGIKQVRSFGGVITPEFGDVCEGELISKLGPLQSVCRFTVAIGKVLVPLGWLLTEVSVLLTIPPGKIRERMEDRGEYVSPRLESIILDIILINWVVFGFGFLLFAMGLFVGRDIAFTGIRLMGIILFFNIIQMYWDIGGYGIYGVVANIFGGVANLISMAYHWMNSLLLIGVIL